MRALVVDAFGVPGAVREVPDPRCPADGIVVEVAATGLCRSDWHAWVGHDPDVELPHVPGHEFAGTVLAVGSDVVRVQVGDRVTVPFVCACGKCATCRAGAAQVCERQYQPGFTGWGSFAQRVVVPRADLNVVALPDALDFVTAAGLGCRFATAYRAVVAHGRVGTGDRVAVLGCGGVGLAATMIARSRGASVIAVDVSPAARDLALAVGADVAVDAPDAIAPGPGGGVDVAIDAIGSAATCVGGISSLRRRGRFVQVGLMVGADARPPVPMDRVLAYELEIYGSHGMAAAGYPPMLAEIAAGRLDPGRLVAAVISLDDLAGADGALAAMSTGSPRGTLVVVP